MACVVKKRCANIEGSCVAILDRAATALIRKPSLLDDGRENRIILRMIDQEIE